MPHALSRKIKEAFVLQAIIASLTIIAGVAAIGYLTGEALSNERMRSEAASFWEGRLANQAYPLPNASTISGFLLPPDADPAALPAELRKLEPGISSLKNPGRKVLVERRPEGTLYLSASFRLVERAILWTGLASILLALLSVYIVTWLTYRASKRMVSPISRLAEQVSSWDPRHPDIGSMASAALVDGNAREMRQLRGALRGLALRIREFVQRERDFTRDASHELRTPLTVIRMATDLMMADADVPDRAQRSLQRMQRAGRDMEAVIDAFLILARDAGTAPLSEQFDVRDVVHNEVDKARPLLEGKPVALTVTETASPQLHASPRVLGVLVGNLLGNACTFTDRGSIEVVLEADRIVIRDSGVGMTAETLEKACDPFYRADPSSASGKGLGLAIVRRLGERFDWPITLESEPGVGTTATIRFTS